MRQGKLSLGENRYSMIEHRSIVWAEHGTKRRRGVVLEVVNGLAVVTFVYGTRRELDHVAVDPNSRDGKTLLLTKPTFFYARGGVSFVPLRACEDTGRRCSPELFEKLTALHLRATTR